jgi:addiction module antitoxin, RelB/DinJ family
MPSVSVQVRVDEEMREQADSLFRGLGMDTATAVRIFLAAAIRRRGIPFDVAEVDGFYNPYNQARIADAMHEMDEGKGEFHRPIDA